MSVATHLEIAPDDYDQRIRTLIPLYDELLAEAANALAVATRPLTHLVDLGIGTGALTQACLRVAPRARITGIDEDTAMMGMVARRLGRRSSRVGLMPGSFLDIALPACDGIVATYSLHHVREPKAKQRLYRRCYEAIAPGGVMISGDCMPASTSAGFTRDLDVWYTHLATTFGSRAKGRKVYESWADEDVYMPLRDEVRMFEKAGFVVDVPWRKSPFAVIAAYRP